MVDDKMFCVTHIDKNTNEDVLLCRIGEPTYEKAIEMNDVLPMEFTGKSMKGYVYVTAHGIRNNKDLYYSTSIH